MIRRLPAGVPRNAWRCSALGAGAAGARRQPCTLPHSPLCSGLRSHDRAFPSLLGTGGRREAGAPPAQGHESKPC